MALKKETLDEQIKKRADQRVQQRIATFKASVVRACDELFQRKGSSSSTDPKHPYQKQYPLHVQQACSVLASADHRKGWPSDLWEQERHEVTTEVMATMNELQKVLLASGDAGENEPA